LNKVEAMKKIDSLTDPMVKEVGHLFLGLEFKFVAGGPETIIERRGQTIGHIDLLFRDPKLRLLFFIEVSTQKERRSQKISHFFARWTQRGNIEVIQDRFQLPNTDRNLRLYFDLSKNEVCLESIAQIVKEDGNRVLDQSDFDYFTDVYKKTGKWARNDLLSFLEVKPREETITRKDAIQFFLRDDVRAYAFVDSAINLLEYCYVSRRRKNDSGYQRTLERGRISGIAAKITDGILAFPNSILIRCVDSDQLCPELKQKSECPVHVKIQIPNYFSTCRIIDGQHRLMSFSKLTERQQEAHFLPVVALENIEESDEVKAFIEINAGQKKMDINLILLLQAGFEWNLKTDEKEYFEKQAVIIAQRLNAEDPLKGKIFIPRALEKKKGKVALATLVKAIISNNFIGENIHLYQPTHQDMDTPHKRIKTIFVLLKLRMPRYCRDTDSFFLTNKGLRVLFRLVQIYERNTLNTTIERTLDEFFIDLERVFSDGLVKRLNDFYGEGGANKAVQEVFRILQAKAETKKSYANIVGDLRKLPYE